MATSIGSRAVGAYQSISIALAPWGLEIPQGPVSRGAQKAPRMHDGTQRVQTSQDHPGDLWPGPGDGPGLWARASCPKARVLFAWARDQDISTYLVTSSLLVVRVQIVNASTYVRRTGDGKGKVEAGEGGRKKAMHGWAVDGEEASRTFSFLC